MRVSGKVRASTSFGDDGHVEIMLRFSKSSVEYL
jgi:hypothetical protein